MKKNEFRAMLDAQGISRTDGYSVEPEKIEVTWSDNPRRDYGTGTEEWDQLKISIKNEGVKVPLDVYYDETKEELRLAHGFRRMKAVQELIKEGTEFKKIRVNIINNNEETILISHLSLNTGKPLNDVEKANILGQLNKRGFEPKEIAGKTGINLQKVYQLIEFDKNAGKTLKDAVAKDEIKITAAKKVIKKAKTITAQEELLEKAAKTKKKKRIRAQDIDKPEEKTIAVSPLIPEGSIGAKISTQIPSMENIKAVIEMLSQHSYSKEEMDEIGWECESPEDAFAYTNSQCLRLLGAM